jgi:hypothetical protein
VTVPEGKEQPNSHTAMETRVAIWVRIVIGIATVVIGFATVFISISALRVQRSLAEFQKTNALGDIELKKWTIQSETDLESAKMAISVIPMMSCQDDIRWASAFRVLDSVMPEGTLRPAAKYEKALADVLLSKCPKQSPQARSEISAIRKQVSLQQVQNDFLVTLANARTYQEYGFDGTAARLFYEAGNRLPPALAGKVDMAELEKALAAYKEGDFSEASGRFQKAFSRIQ